MKKVINLNRSVYELVKEFPELADIMDQLGFNEFKKPAMLSSVGKIMTIPKGAKMKDIAMRDVVSALTRNGFTLEGEVSVSIPTSMHSAEKNDIQIPDERTEQLKGYLRRLGAGEDLESVRADFVKAFGDVDASEIMKAEQELIEEGTPLAEVQKLCDIHSALFHGETREEKIANAEKAVEASLKKAASSGKDYGDKKARAAALEQISGHPLQTLTCENDALQLRIDAARTALAAGNDMTEALAKVREVIVHYEKKGDLLYPLLQVRYGIAGPSDVMWTVDDEIRDELAALTRETERGEAWSNRAEAVFRRAEEMIYKEQNILFPICAVNFSENEWHGIYRDAKGYDDCLGVTGAVWDAAEQGGDEPASAVGVDEIVMPGGHMTVAQLTAMLNTIPAEISFVDAENINRYFNEGRKVFKRPGMAIDRDVFSCHPPKIEPMVRGIIEDFRTGRRDRVPVWFEKDGHIMMVNYMAVRDKDGNYLGTMEFDQDMELAREYFREHFTEQ